MGTARQLLLSSMLYEMEEVLHYPRIQQLYALTDGQIASYLHELAEAAELVELGPPVALPLTDRHDWMVLRTAIGGDADVLCSNDGGFFKTPVLALCTLYELRVMKPVDLLARLIKRGH